MKVMNTTCVVYRQFPVQEWLKDEELNRSIYGCFHVLQNGNRLARHSATGSGTADSIIHCYIKGSVKCVRAFITVANIRKFHKCIRISFDSHFFAEQRKPFGLQLHNYICYLSLLFSCPYMT